MCAIAFVIGEPLLFRHDLADHAGGNGPFFQPSDDFAGLVRLAGDDQSPFTDGSIRIDTEQITDLADGLVENDLFQ